MSSNPDRLDTELLELSMVPPRKVHVKLRLGKVTMTLTLNIYNHDVAGGPSEIVLTLMVRIMGIRTKIARITHNCI